MDEAEIKIKRAYENPASDDGIRVLVDRLWPRGITKESLKLDYWLKEVAPSNELRKWFHHESGKFEDFKMKYKEELQQKHLQELNQIKEGPGEVLTLVYGAKDEKHNQAVVLKEILEQKTQ